MNEIVSTKKVVIQIPTRPNFIKVDGKNVAVEDIAIETLKLIAEEWTKNLLEHTNKTTPRNA